MIIEYKRLTKRNANGEVETVKRPKSSYIQEVYEEWDEINRELKLRLAKLEDKIEAGTLVELPCRVGDVMYEVIGDACIDEWEIESICFNKTYPKGVIWAERTRDFAHWKFWIEDCGTKWFATKAEAEKRLEDIRNETKSIDNSEN